MRKPRTRIWGNGVLNQVSLDLKASFPNAQGFTKDNLYRMARFYQYYAELQGRQRGFVLCEEDHSEQLMLSHAIAADFYKDTSKPLHNFQLTLPKPQGDLTAEMMKSELNLGFLRLKEGYTEADAPKPEN